jgi:outer membrane protein assembly factor BamD
LLAINSVPSKMEERLTNAKIAYDKLIKFNNDTKYKDKADKMLATIDKELQQFSNK